MNIYLYFNKQLRLINIDKLNNIKKTQEPIRFLYSIIIY